MATVVVEYWCTRTRFRVAVYIFYGLIYCVLLPWYMGSIIQNGLGCCCACTRRSLYDWLFTVHVSILGQRPAYGVGELSALSKIHAQGPLYSVCGLRYVKCSRGNRRGGRLWS